MQGQARWPLARPPSPGWGSVGAATGEAPGKALGWESGPGPLGAIALRGLWNPSDSEAGGPPALDDRPEDRRPLGDPAHLPPGPHR